MNQKPDPTTAGAPFVPRNLGIRVGMLLAFAITVAVALVLYVLHARGTFEEFQRLTLVTDKYDYQLKQAPGASFTVSYSGISEEPISFTITNLVINAKGISLKATVSEEPVRLKGINTKFTFRDSGFEMIDSVKLGSAGTANLLWNGSLGQNCVITLKMASVGTPTATSAFLEPEGSTRTTDSGNFSYYAGPVKRTAPSCVKWGGSAGGNSYTSGFEHCA